MSRNEQLTARELDKADWLALDLGSPYYSKPYCDASGTIEPDFETSTCLEFKDEATKAVAYLPLLLRNVQGTEYFDATSPYGYGGLRGEPIAVESFQTAISNWGAQRGVICVFIRSNPAEPYEFEGGLPPTDLTTLGPTVLWPTDSAEALLPGMKKKHRQYTRKAERAGLNARAIRDVTSLSTFVDLYLQSMRRLGAGEYYMFNDRYWESLVSRDGPELLLVEVSLQGDTVCSLLCLVGARTLHAHLLGTSDVGRELKANYLAYFRAAEWAAMNGRASFHLGGGFGGAESDLLDWKTGFCPAAPTADFSISKMVLDEEAFVKFAGTRDTSGHFPPWRA